MTYDDATRPAEDASLTAVMADRRRLMNLAYRLLGSVAEAEDAVQEGYARWYAMSEQDRDAIRSPGAWLTTVIGRICLDLLGSARSRREQYVGEWVPEPLPDGADWASTSNASDPTSPDPADRVTLDESVTMAFLVTLESMTPAERVALILHDVFGYSYPEIADVVGRTAQACRQLAYSARNRARSTRVPPAQSTEQSELVRAFRKAWEAHDVNAILDVLDPDAIAIADGGGVTQAALAPIVGAAQIGRHYLTIAARRPDHVTIAEEVVNGRPGLVVRLSGSAVTVLAFDVVDHKIKQIWAIVNPAKLRHWDRRTI
ncbi:RNA polymerase sigma factor SigJ [Microlunatus soli]|uniref:RNA polymerase sigma-70 factor, ECF subfamily n=1 Tax=Microlunatus soli TaxID=630515 RepID=A0A1H1YW56_9ACTN|nr:RNA polymerase sigma factor SigJ [Microlunatus soli]SDT25612.1 RNA polymerase sigma-70 factor, ECF subfamily [Microlunatus soli]